MPIGKTKSVNHMFTKRKPPEAQFWGFSFGLVVITVHPLSVAGLGMTTLRLYHSHSTVDKLGNKKAAPTAAFLIHADNRT